jgi:hypothetical protein
VLLFFHTLGIIKTSMKKSPLFGLNVCLTTICLSLLLVTCKNDDDPNPTITLLTFKQDASTPTENTDDWIFVTDESGTLLDIKQFEADQTISLTSNQTTAGQKINVTIFQYSEATNELMTFNSYLDIASNQSWTEYKKVATTTPFPPIAGTFTINVNNYPSGFSYFFVTTNALHLAGSGPVSSSQYGLLNTAPTKITISSYRDNIPVYTNLTVSVGNTYTLDFLTDFEPMEHVLSYDMTDASLYSVNISAFDEPATPNSPQGHTIANYGSTSNPTAPGNLVTGWPDGFNSYKISVWAVYPNVFKLYYKFGAGATATPFMDNITSSVTNPDYKNFAFTSTGNYQMRTSVWSNQIADPAINWIFNSSTNGIQRFSDIPAELTSKYPVLGTTTLSFLENGFTRYLDGFTYEDYIQSIMNVSTAAKPFPTEYQMIAFY